MFSPKPNRYTRLKNSPLFRFGFQGSDCDSFIYLFFHLRPHSPCVALCEKTRLTFLNSSAQALFFVVKFPNYACMRTSLMFLNKVTGREILFLFTRTMTGVEDLILIGSAQEKKLEFIFWSWHFFTREIRLSHEHRHNRVYFESDHTYKRQ